MGDVMNEDERVQMQQQTLNLQRSSYSVGQNSSTYTKAESGSPSRFNAKKSIFKEMNDKFSQLDSGLVDKQPKQNKFEKQFKVHYIYEKLQDRLKLRKRDGDQNFRKMMQEFKQLDTFVDTRQQIQGMNLAFQKGFKSSLEVLKIRDKINQLNKELKDTSNKYQMQFGEYEVNEDNAESTLQSIKGAKQAKELLRRSKKYLQTNSKNLKNLDSTQAITDSLKGYIQKNIQSVNQIELKDDINEFYTNLESVFESQKKLISLKEQHDELEKKKQEEKEKQLRELIKKAKYDMDGENEKNIPNQGYFNEYHDRTQQTINKAIKESKRIYRQKLGLINQKEKLFLDIQENIIDKALDKPTLNISTDVNGQGIPPIPIANQDRQQQSQQQYSTPQLKPLIIGQHIKSKSGAQLYSRSNQSTPSKSNFLTQVPSSMHSQNKLVLNSQISYHPFSQKMSSTTTSILKAQSIPKNQFTFSSASKLNQNTINQMITPSRQIEEVQSNDSFEKNSPYYANEDEIIQNEKQDDKLKRVEIKLNNLVYIPSLSGLSNIGQKNQIMSTISTARDTLTLAQSAIHPQATNTDVDTRHQSLIEYSNNETERNQFGQSYQTYYTSINQSNIGVEQKQEYVKIPQISLISNEQLKQNDNRRSSNSHARSTSNNLSTHNRQSILQKSLPTRALRRLQLTSNTPINRQSLNNTNTTIIAEQRKKSLASLTEEVSQIVKQMKSPKNSQNNYNNDLQRLNSVQSPKSMQHSIERRNVFLSNLGNQQDTIKQFINTMKQAECSYKEEKQQLMSQLQEVKAQYKSTQEKYEDPKITSIREVEQNVEHKFKNFLRRNYKPKTMQIANY